VSATRRTPVARAERESDLLREAGVVFAERGFHAASMDEIAERVGVSKPVVYSHFGSKDALYFAYIEAAGNELLDAMVTAERASRERSYAERLHAGSLAFFRFVDDHREGFVVLYGELAARGAPYRREVIAVRRRIVALVRALLDEIERESGADLDERGGTESLATAFVGAGESLANWWLEHPDEPVEDVTARLMNVAWVGLETLARGGGGSWPTDE
jgi:AcrR family transcriptional regulator